ncbi:hypothetical protein AJ80_02036 [Polytolypa hystricis UAMH7299]|uniref:LYR motif-containing protein Cup1-like N-terminal domain-containing protein n=1 Tax=Polytolypa hystricis (strain UAMH7299) TaxID=1447883 RepID=A0A2B7YIR6_POLH7|nr:hypothetical protein AJ80_02036 [Polytolypa hystricis UAMH7299]
MAHLYPVPHWRHVYRALLRESGYLPDPIARPYMHNYVRLSYRENWPKIIPNSAASPYGQIHLERKARKLLSLLTRANEGYLKPLERVLMLSYGRAGVQRRNLLEPLLGLPEQIQKAKRPYPADYSRIVLARPAEWEPLPTLQALIDSQVQRRELKQLGLTERIKETKPEYPGTNVWGQEASPKKLNAVKRKWFMALVDNLLPPLPEDQWNTLSGLVIGTEPWTEPQRRPRRALDEWSRSALDAEFLVFGPKKGETFEKFAKGRPHHIKRKLMQNLWDKVCTATPRMHWDGNKGQWLVQWGSPKVEAPIYRTLDPGMEDALFGGVDAKTGQLLKT